MNAAAIQATVGADAGPLRAAGPEIASAAGKIAGEITKKFEMKDLGRFAATALGINLNDIAIGIARIVTGISKEAEESYKRLGELSDQVTAKTLENMRAGMSEEQKYRQALQTAARAQSRIEENLNVTLAQREQLLKDQLIQANAISEINAYERKAAEEDRKAGEDWLEKTLKMRRDQQAETDKKQAEGFAADLDWAKKVMAADRELASIAFEKLAPEKQLVELRKEQAILQKEINDPLTDELKKKQDLIDMAKTEEKITRVQAQLKKDIVESVKEQAAEEISLINEWEGFVLKMSAFGRGDKSLSDRELARKKQEIQDDIFQREMAARMAPGDTTGFGGYDPLLTQQQMNLQNLINEMKLRDDVRRTVATSGEDAAFSQFPGLSEARFREIIGTATDQTRVVDEVRGLRQDLTTGKAVVGTIARD